MPVENKIKNLRRKKNFECIFYIEMNKKVSCNIVLKIDIKNVTRVFLIDFY